MLKGREGKKRRLGKRGSPCPWQPETLFFPWAASDVWVCRLQVNEEEEGYVSFGSAATTRNKLAVLGKLRHQQHLAFQ